MFMKIIKYMCLLIDERRELFKKVNAIERRNNLELYPSDSKITLDDLRQYYEDLIEDFGE